MRLRAMPFRSTSLLLILLLSNIGFGQQPVYPGTISNYREPAQLKRAQDLARLGVTRWHARGVRGAGLKVAIMDSGFRGYKDHLGKALPKQVTVKSFRRDEKLEAKNSQHGILCAEVIHAMAPDAQIYLMNWEPNHPVQFLKAVQWAKSQGVRIISCSIIMPTWSDGEGNGAVHRELKKIIGTGGRADDILFFACAGNTAERHWGGKFQKGPANYHLWDGRSIDNVVLPWGTGNVSVELCGATGTDFELLVYDATDQSLLGRSTAKAASAHRCAVVRFYPLAGHTYVARARETNGKTGRFHLYVLGGGIQSQRQQSSIPFPGDGKEVVTVGAASPTGKRLSYSSCGNAETNTKPNLVATVPFQSLWRDRPFTGTSAAAPQAAGMAALLWSRRVTDSPKAIRELLTGSAIDVGTRGRDWETGAGLLQAPRTIQLNRATTKFQATGK